LSGAPTPIVHKSALEWPAIRPSSNLTFALRPSDSEAKHVDLQAVIDYEMSKNANIDQHIKPS